MASRLAAMLNKAKNSNPIEQVEILTPRPFDIATTATIPQVQQQTLAFPSRADRSSTYATADMLDVTKGVKSVEKVKVLTSRPFDIATTATIPQVKQQTLSFPCRAGSSSSHATADMLDITKGVKLVEKVKVLTPELFDIVTIATIPQVKQQTLPFVHATGGMCQRSRLSA